MEKVLELYKLVNGEEQPFPSSDEQIITSDFTYTAKRMGGAPTITCSVRSYRPLNHEWSEEVYVRFNGEKHYLRRIPSSTFDNTSDRYKFDVEFVSERINLESTLFFDVVEQTSGEDGSDYQYITRNTKFQFFGTIDEFVLRLNASFKSSNLGYQVIKKHDGITTDAKMVSIEDKFLAEALQEIHSTYELPYYYDPHYILDDGSEIRAFVVGNKAEYITDDDGDKVVFEYGSDKSLVSVTKSNTNQKIINRITGYGSEDNIPSYYPNPTSKGEVELTTAPEYQGKFRVKDKALFAQQVDLNEQIYYKLLASTNNLIKEHYNWRNNTWVTPNDKANGKGLYEAMAHPVWNGSYYDYVWWDGLIAHQRFSLLFKVHIEGVEGSSLRLALHIPDIVKNLTAQGMMSYVIGGPNKTITQRSYNGREINIVPTQEDHPDVVYFDFTVLYDKNNKGDTEVQVDFETQFIPGVYNGDVYKINFNFMYDWLFWLRYSFSIYNQTPIYGWKGNNLTSPTVKPFGLEYANGFNPEDNPEYWVEQGLWFGLKQSDDYIRIPPQKYLMPSIYRESNGQERFYNAVNDIYDIPDIEEGNEQTKYHFPNQWFSGKPKEHIQAFEDIKPTIVGMKNSVGQMYNEILDVAFDDGDNDEQDDQGNFKHPYFFVKLPKFDGNGAFNLFEQQIDEAAMTISMLTGECGACEFEIGVSENTQKNLVQVYTNEQGQVTLLRNSAGEVVRTGAAPQESQNDTRNNEVWVALKKDIESYGQVMPNREQGLRPKKGDSFVLLHINLPDGYIKDAEKRLENALIKYMYDNNVDKFSFSMKFSRIYLEEHAHVLNSLDENATISLRYEGNDYTLFASSFTYKMNSNAIVPEITIDVSDTIQKHQTALDKAIAPVKADISNKINSINFVEQCSPYFLRKDINDTAIGKINFSNGSTFGISNTSDDFSVGKNGAGIYKDEAGQWHVETDFLDVRKVMSVETLDISETRHINGEQLLSSASAVFDLVDERPSFYRCYFRRIDSKGHSVLNKWMVGDQAYYCTFDLAQTDEKGDDVADIRYYWRKVVGVGNGEVGKTTNINNKTLNLSDYHFIDLSKNECDNGSVEPRIYDSVVQLGYQGDDAPERQNAIVLAGAGEGSPYIRQYVGIKSFYLPEPETQIKPNDNILSGSTRFKDYNGEERALNDVSKAWDETKQQVENLEVGINLLRNTGFTGDYESIQLDLFEKLDENTYMFSPSLAHWQYRGVEVVENTDSASGYSAILEANCQLKQELFFPIEKGASYILSLKAKSVADNTFANIAFEVGGTQMNIDTTSDAQLYEKKFVAEANGNMFYITTSLDIELYELALRRGTVASSTWEASPLDGRKEQAQYESLSYLKNLLKANTVIDGGVVSTGVVNTGLINMGHYDEDGNITEITAGMSGTYNNDDSVAFFGGGDLAKAIYTVQKYKENPNYEPTTEELASMAKAVITHGGRAILQDIILRGYVYAEGGVFRGTVYANNGKFAGEVEASTGHIGSMAIDNQGLSVVGEGSNMVLKPNEITLTIPSIYLGKPAGATYSSGLGGKGRGFDDDYKDVALFAHVNDTVHDRNSHLAPAFEVICNLRGSTGVAMYAQGVTVHNTGILPHSKHWVLEDTSSANRLSLFYGNDFCVDVRQATLWLYMPSKYEIQKLFRWENFLCKMTVTNLPYSNTYLSLGFPVDSTNVSEGSFKLSNDDGTERTSSQIFLQKGQSVTMYLYASDTGYYAHIPYQINSNDIRTE